MAFSYRIYFYKLTSDTGGAPCVQNGVLSLAICKPMIRGTAEKGDLIFGFAARSLHPDNRLIYAARVTEKLGDGRYYKDARYAQRGDCIYRHKAGHFEWRNGSLHHGPKDVVRDLGNHPEYPRANVLLSRDFRYFGEAGSDEYKSKFPRVRRAVERLGRGHRVHQSDALRHELRRMKSWLWRSTSRNKVGAPMQKPSRCTSYRSRSCGVV
jgi:hypothetical protein